MTPAEIGRLFEEMGAGLLLYARHLLHHTAPSSAEDLVQEAFVRFARQKEMPPNPRAWMLLTVRRLALDDTKGSLRRAKRDRQAGRERWFEHQPGRTPEAMEPSDVEEGLRELSPEEREAIVLRIWNGAGFQEAAEVMGLPLSTVYLRYRSGLEKLRIRWELPCRKK